jgi:hypothetical protein
LFSPENRAACFAWGRILRAESNMLTVGHSH